MIYMYPIYMTEILVYEKGKKRMRLIDMHCDTLSKLYHQSDLGDLFDSVCEVNIKKLQMADSMVQFFACFTCFQDYLNYDLCYQDVLSMIAYFEKQEEKYGDKYYDYDCIQESGNPIDFSLIKK